MKNRVFENVYLEERHGFNDFVWKYRTKESLELLKPYCYYDDVKRLVLDICQLHNSFSKSLSRSRNFVPVNLKKKLITDVSVVFEDRGVFIIDNPFTLL